MRKIKGFRAELRTARDTAKKKVRYMSKAQAGGIVIKLELLSKCNDGSIYEEFKCKPVATGVRGMYAKKVPFLKEWIQPIAWVLESMGWSLRAQPNDSAAQCRTKTVSYLELTCAVDLLTGQAVGPADAPLSVKTAVVRQGVNEVLRIGTVDTGNAKQLQAAQLISPLPEVDSCDIFGFPKAAGLDRRPTFAQYKGLNEGIATMLTYAKAHALRLMTPAPRIGFKSVWRKDWVAATWAMIPNKGRLASKDLLIPDLRQIDVRKAKVSKDDKLTDAKDVQESQADREARAAQGAPSLPSRSTETHEERDVHHPPRRGGDAAAQTGPKERVKTADDDQPAKTDETAAKKTESNAEVLRYGNPDERRIAKSTTADNNEAQSQSASSCETGTQSKAVGGEPQSSCQANRPPKAAKHGTTLGPCAFGCTKSAKQQGGREVWMRVPEPSPWVDVTSGSVICSKHYDRARKMQKDQRLKESRQRAAEEAVDGAGHKAADGAGKLDSTVETNAVAAQPLLCCPVLGVGAATAEQSGMEVPPAAEQSKIEPKNSRARQGPCAFGCERSAKRRAGKQVWMGIPRPNPWADIDDNAVLCSKCYERGLAINRKKPVASPATQMQEARPAEEIAPPACAEATSTAQVTSGGGGGIRTSYSNGNSVGGARCVVAVKESIFPGSVV